MPALRSASEYDDETFDDLVAPEETFTGIHFEGCDFRGAELNGATFSWCRFIDCRFERGDLSNLKVSNSSFRGVTFAGTKLIGIDWTTANPQMGFDVAFRDAVLDYGNFAEIDMLGVSFERCRARELGLDGCDLRKVYVDDTDFEGTFVRDADLRRAKLSGAHGLAIDLATCRVAKMRISVDTAEATLAAMDVSVVR